MELDLTLALAEILAGIDKDQRPGMADHHSRLDALRLALLERVDTVDGIFADDLTTAWNDCMSMTPEQWAATKQESAEALIEARNAEIFEWAAAQPDPHPEPLAR